MSDEQTLNNLVYNLVFVVQSHSIMRHFYSYSLYSFLITFFLFTQKGLFIPSPSISKWRQLQNCLTFFVFCTVTVFCCLELTKNKWIAL